MKQSTINTQQDTFTSDEKRKMLKDYMNHFEQIVNVSNDARAAYKEMPEELQKIIDATQLSPIEFPSLIDTINTCLEQLRPFLKRYRELLPQELPTRENFINHLEQMRRIRISGGGAIIHLEKHGEPYPKYIGIENIVYASAMAAIDAALAIIEGEDNVDDWGSYSGEQYGEDGHYLKPWQAVILVLKPEDYEHIKENGILVEVEEEKD